MLGAAVYPFADGRHAAANPNKAWPRCQIYLVSIALGAPPARDVARGYDQTMSSIHEQPGIPAPTAERGGEHASDAAPAQAPPGSTPTAAQLRRFIKSRPYVPLHELRRRFELNGEMDEVTAVRTLDGLTVYVGLPERESQLIGDLARDGDIGLELGRDPRVPIVVGVYPLRPVGRG